MRRCSHILSGASSVLSVREELGAGLGYLIWSRDSLHVRWGCGTRRRPRLAAMMFSRRSKAFCQGCRPSGFCMCSAKPFWELVPGINLGGLCKGEPPQYRSPNSRLPSNPKKVSRISEPPTWTRIGENHLGPLMGIKRPAPRPVVEKPSAPVPTREPYIASRRSSDSLSSCWLVGLYPPIHTL